MRVAQGVIRTAVRRRDASAPGVRGTFRTPALANFCFRSTGSADFKSHRAVDVQGFRRRVSPLRRFKFNRPEFSVRSVGATRSAWARETAGASPAALTSFRSSSSSSASQFQGLSRITVIRPVVTRNMLVRFQPEQPVSRLRSSITRARCF